MKKKLIAILCAVVLLFSMAAMPANAIYCDWTSHTLPDGVDYSFVVLGDLQWLTWSDALKSTSYLDSIFDWILGEDDSAGQQTRNIQYVFGVGDSVDSMYGRQQSATDIAAEWNAISTQYNRLSDDERINKIPYSVAIGNHDEKGDYHNYICTENYRDQMTGFYYDPSKPISEHGNSMSNSYRKIEICDKNGVPVQKYLMLTLDYHAGDDVLDWANNLVAANPDYRVIVNTHVYMDGAYSRGYGVYKDLFNASTDGNEIGYTDYDENGDIITSELSWNTSFSAQNLWDNFLSHHDNIIMTVCGHDSLPMPVVNERTRERTGTKMIEILADTDSYNLKTHDDFPESTPTNLLMVLNFDEDNNKIYVEVLSPEREQQGKLAHATGPNGAVHQQTLYYEDIGVIDFVDVFAELGYKNFYTGNKRNATRTLDGTISEGEYTETRVIAQDAPNARYIESDIVEYLAHDDDNIYYAFTATQTRDNGAISFQFRVQNHAVFPSKLNLYKKHVTATVRYNETNGSITLDSLGSNQPGIAAPVWDTDIKFAIQEDDNNNKTCEIVISKDYLADQLGINKSELKYLAYNVHLDVDDNGNYRWNAFDATANNIPTIIEKLGGERELDNLYYLMVLDESPDAIQNVIKPATKDGASARISTENPGLRFKTKINRAELDALIDKYGKDNINNVSVGILIAPLDKLGNDPLALTHAFGEVNVDFVDVKVSTTDDMDNPIDFRDNVFPDEDDAETNYTFSGSLANIKIKNLGREFVGRGYISYVDFNGETHYIYADTVCVRSVDHVATKALEDTTKDYSLEARAILEKLTVKYYEDLVKDPFEEDPFYATEN